MKYAFSDGSCDNCGNFMAQGEPVYFESKEKFCHDCANTKGIACKKCGEQKKRDFEECYTCHVGKLKGKG